MSDRATDERGAVIVMVAVFLTCAIGFAALALDLGNAWQGKRQLNTATDSAAFAAAEVYAFGGNGCSAIASSYLTTNDGGSTLTSCSTAAGTHTASGYVTVKSSASTANHFAASAVSNLSTQSTAQWGVPSSAGGMRPIALCENFPAVSTWLTAPTSESGVIQVPYTKGSIGCNNSPGNWQLLDLDDTNSGGANDLKDWFLNGYPDPISFPTNILAQTGHVSSLQTAMQSLVDSGEVFPIALYDLVTGNGNNTQYHAVGPIMVKLIAFSITGSQSSQYLTLKLEPHLVDGTCCGSGPDTGARAVSMCAVNSDPTSGKCG